MFASIPLIPGQVVTYSFVGSFAARIFRMLHNPGDYALYKWTHSDRVQNRPQVDRQIGRNVPQTRLILVGSK